MTTYRDYSNGILKVRIAEKTGDATGSSEYYIAAIFISYKGRWELLAEGREGHEFSTKKGSFNANAFVERKNTPLVKQIELSYSGEEWEIWEMIQLKEGENYLTREQIYRPRSTVTTAIHPEILVRDDDAINYIFPLRSYGLPMVSTPHYRADDAWALPFPFHVYYTEGWVAGYGVDRLQDDAHGTLDFTPGLRWRGKGYSQLRIWCPQSTGQRQEFYETPSEPGTTTFPAGQLVRVPMIFFAKVLETGDDALTEAEKIVKDAMNLSIKPRHWDFEGIADRIVRFYKGGGLWNPDALGKGKGWFRNMWKYTACGKPAKDDKYDLGWGEGYGIHIMKGLVDYWHRTGDQEVLKWVDEMGSNMEMFRRDKEHLSPYYDRYDGKGFADFNGNPYVWTHSNGRLASLLLEMYREYPDYPNSETRGRWYSVAKDISDFYLQQQVNGDLRDCYTSSNAEGNQTGVRIPARLIMAKAWVLLHRITGDDFYLKAAEELAMALRPEVENYHFYNQMIDATSAGHVTWDAEGAFYTAEGLIEIYRQNREETFLNMAKRAIGYAISWTYFYDLPKAHKSISLGATTCRMPDFPLLFAGGTAKGVPLMFRMYELTGDLFYQDMARMMLQYLAANQIDDPARPWHGGIIHAFDQHDGHFWGPEQCGQVDTGESTGGTLMAVEYYLRWRDRYAGSVKRRG